MRAIHVGSYLSRSEDQICYFKEQGIWYIHFPEGLLGNLSAHTVVENPDSTISVSPSILVNGHLATRHGYLENSIWRDC